MKQFIGQIDDNINFCPHCGKRLELVSVVGQTCCPACGKSFLVLKNAERILPPIQEPQRKKSFA